MTVVGAITQEKVIAFDIIGKSMKGEDFKKFVKEHLVPELWDGAVVVMDRLRAHQVEGIKEMVEEVGAKVIYLSGYSPDFNPIEHLWWELKAFIRRFVPKSKIVVEALLRMAVKYLNLVCSSPQLFCPLLLLYVLNTQRAVSLFYQSWKTVTLFNR